MRRLAAYFTSKMSRRLGAGYVLGGLLIVSCAGAGYWGIRNMGSTLDFITGPAWSTADGAMEGVIEIEAQMLAASDLMNRGNFDEGKKALAELQVSRDEALGKCSMPASCHTA